MSIVSFVLLAAGTVDVFVGSSGLGHVTPAATAPFGMVQAGPDTSSDPAHYHADWAHTSGYQHGDLWCWRFSQTHISGTGCISFGDYGLMPFVAGYDPLARAAYLYKPDETAAPGRYAATVCWDKKPIRVEIAARERSAAYRITYPEGERALLLFDCDGGAEGRGNGTDCWGRTVKDSVVAFPTARSVTACGSIWSWNDYRLAIAAEFSASVVSSRCVRAATDVRGAVWELDFGVLPKGTLEIRLALSHASVEGARKNLAAEMPRFDFEGNLRAAAAAWDEKLSRLVLDEKSDPVVMANFRSALYRTMIQPNLLSDVGAPRRFSTFSLWDTFRAAHPLYTLLVPEYVDDFVNSLLDQYDRQGYLPIWALGGSENHCMIGHHAVPVIADAYLKGFRGFDARRAYAAVKDSLTRGHKAVNAGTWGLVKEDWDLLDRYGYYPFDRLTGSYKGQPVKGESVARLLECAYDDACAARFAAALGETADAAFFAKRAHNWTNVYDRASGFMRGRDSKGAWRTPFDPYALGGGPWTDNDFCEGNAWQYTWHVMQDSEGLIAAMGGRERFVARLTELFEQGPHVYRDRPTADVTGLIGQYAHGNEPSHHTIYFFTLAGRRDLAAKYVRKVFETQYSPKADGLCGNDDCGQMAAWYVFSTLGFYPFDPCGGTYVRGAMQVPSFTWRIGGKSRTVTAAEFAAWPDTVGASQVGVEPATGDPRH